MVTSGQFHKHFTIVTYGLKNKVHVIHSMNATMQCLKNAQAYFAKAVSYTHKMFMKFTLGVNAIKLFLQTNKLEHLSKTKSSICVCKAPALPSGAP